MKSFREFSKWQEVKPYFDSITPFYDTDEVKGKAKEAREFLKGKYIEGQKANEAEHIAFQYLLNLAYERSYLTKLYMNKKAVK